MVLTENYRSSRAVLNAAQALDAGFTFQGTIPVTGDVCILAGRDEGEEARLAVDAIQALLVDGHPDVEGTITPDRCAVLARNRYALVATEEALVDRDIQYYKQVRTQHESESDTMRDFELCMRLLAHPKDRFHLELLVSRWEIELGLSRASRDQSGPDLLKTIAEKVTAESQRAVLQAIGALKWSPLDVDFAAGLDHLGKYAQTLADGEGKALLLQDIQVWQEHWGMFVRNEPGGCHRLNTFLGQVALGATQRPRREGIGLLTVHAAKGLEFDVVAIVGMSEGTFPDYRAKESATAMQEEGRNAFVAVTRSRRLLYCTYPKKKMMPWGDTKGQEPSRFLRAIAASVERPEDEI